MYTVIFYNIQANELIELTSVANESFGCQKAQAKRVNWHNIE